MTDYNDGKWHGWNGGECPVHPESEIEAVCNANGHSWDVRGNAGPFLWDREKASAIVAFRVTKAYVEPPKPREFWLHRDNGNDFAVLDHKPDFRWDEVVHVREVLE